VTLPRDPVECAASRRDVFGRRPGRVIWRSSFSQRHAA
jgi:hypothetical protein